MVTTLSPKVSDTPSRPIPTCGKPAAMTALPHPANVSQNVPINSAAYFRVSMKHLPLYPGGKILPKSSKFRNGGAPACNLLICRGLLGRKSGAEGGHFTFCLIHPRARDPGHGLFVGPWSQSDSNPTT